MAQPSFREILASVKKCSNLPPVIILMGQESYYIDALVEAFENYTIDEDDKDFNLHVFYGNDADIDNVVACAQQFPVMSDRKLVILKEAQSMYQSKSQLEKLAPYVLRPNSQTTFVLAFKGDNLNATSRLLKAAKESGAIIFKSEVVKDYQLPPNVRDYCSAHSFNIDDKALALICDYIGTPLSKIFGELDKLFMIKGDDKKITCDDIERNIGISKEYNNLEFSNALIAKDYPRCIRMIKYFERNPKAAPTVMLTATIFNSFVRLVICHFVPDKSDSAMMQAAGLKSSYALKDIKSGMRKYNPAQAVRAIHYIREFDTKSKGVESYQNEYDLLTELVFKIITS